MLSKLQPFASKSIRMIQRKALEGVQMHNMLEMPA